MDKSQTVQVLNVGELRIANDLPFVLFGGLNVLESEDLAFKTCEKFKLVTNKLEIPFVFKASFDKANRSSIKSFRGPGLDRGLKILAALKQEFNVPIITDIHEPEQAHIAAEVVDIIQIPAFLSRQTDLVETVAKTGKVINVKKAQFLAPEEMGNILTKCQEAGNNKVILCERGTCFGYNNLVVDMLGFPILKQWGNPVIFDVTHALQFPGGLGGAAGGRRQFVLELARSAMAQKLAGLFLEAHPEPSKALCDGPCALPLEYLEDFLYQIKELDNLVKFLPDLKIL